MRTRRVGPNDRADAPDVPEASDQPFPTGAEPAPWAEDGTTTTASEGIDPVLREFDRLFTELRPRLPPPSAVRPVVPHSPYLEERLATAQVAASHARQELNRLTEVPPELVLTVESIVAEMVLARREVEFLRSMESADEPEHAPPGMVTASTPSGPRPRADSVQPQLASGSPRLNQQGILLAPSAAAGFTVGRYNRTIRHLKGQRRKLAGVTLTLAAAISTLLLVLTLSYRTAPPPLWIEVLPMIWLVSIPFFILSFRGTQRVLRGNHLELSGDV